METRELVTRLVRSLDTHKALDMKVLQVTEVTSLADYFIIASGTGSTNVRALADYAEFELGQQGVKPLRIEGYQTSQWILSDYGTVVVHIFQKETRQFYDLEHLWKDGREVDVNSFLENGGQEYEKV